MKKRLSATLVACLALGAMLSAAPSAFDSSRAYQHLREIVGFGPRPAGSPALEATRRYIRQQMKAINVSVADQAFDATTPIGRIRMTNLVATIPGARTDRLVFGGHYDTKLFRDFPFVGANDAGSSTAFLLELARVLKARKNPLTMELVFLDGEEATGEWQGTDHTYGSRHYVEAARKAGTLGKIRAFVLVDMVGGRDLVLERESNSTAWLMDAMVQSARRQKLEGSFAPRPTAIEDDHVPFLEAGVQSVDLIGFNHYAEWWHTREDTLDKTSARSLQVTADIIMGALPSIESRLMRGKGAATKTRQR